MKISYNWLNEYLDLNVSAKDLAETIERGAVEVDAVTQPSDGLKKIVVGKIESMQPHDDSDHLQVCQVDIGEPDLSQIVCGAPNVEAGKKVIVALPGSRIGGNVKIKRSKMRGVISNGMICALDEIGFDKDVVPKEWADGIYFLPDDAVVGEPVFPYLGMDDSLIDIDVTPNRGDMLSVRGTAFDVSALLDTPITLDTKQLKETTIPATDSITIKADEKVAPIYQMRVVKNVHIQPSPLWLQIKLWNAGVRPINNVVDVTNYVLLKYGQPLHAFDLDQVAGSQIEARLAQPGEKLTTLDEEQRNLDTNDIVIADERGPIALAGVMGGMTTEISAATTTVAIEAAVFDATTIRKTAQRHNLHTSAAQHFERGVNLGGVKEALDEAAQLMVELADGEVQQGVITATDKPVSSMRVATTLSHINHVLGTTLTQADVEQIFQRLGFGTEVDGETITVSVPPRRWDILIEADLLEEVARVYGYDKIPATLPSGTATLGQLSQRQKLIRTARQLMEAAGLNQAISYALTTEEKAAQFNMLSSQVTQLSWPMTADHTTLRMNLISGLLDDVAYNHARRVTDVALYEEGRVFYRQEDAKRPVEQTHLAGALSGRMVNTGWQKAREQLVDFYELKGIVELFLKNLAIAGEVVFEATDKYPAMHPGRTADIKVDDQLLGFLGQVHPSVADEYKIDPTYVFELNLDALIETPKKANLYVPISKFPAVTRDIAMLVDDTVTHAEVVATIKKRGGAFLKDVHLFDVYQGEHVPAGKRSLAYQLTYQNTEATLTDDEVNQAFDKVILQLTENLDAEIR